MKAVPGGVIEAWSEGCRAGWGCLIEVLVLAVSGQDKERSGRSQRSARPLGEESLDSPTSSSSESSDYELCMEEFQEGIHDNWLKLPCNGPRIGLLWASIQTEFLTYRRVREGDPWLSENFATKALKTWLEEDEIEFSTPLVQNRMFKRHTRCGWFDSASDFLCPTAKEACTDYFMNMDIYSRASYIGQPDLLASFERVERVGDGEI